jgi:hypothetical protein
MLSIFRLNIVCRPNAPKSSTAPRARQEKESVATLKETIRHLGDRLKEYANALEVDKRMADSTSLLRRPLSQGGSSSRPSSSQGLSRAANIAANVEEIIHNSAQLEDSEQEVALLELLFTGELQSSGHD